jgi:hypothetical protein
MEFVVGQPLRRFDTPPPQDVVTPFIDRLTSPFRSGSNTPNNTTRPGAAGVLAGVVEGATSLAPSADQLAAQQAAPQPGPQVLPMWAADP